jgi:hypothetical protein
MIFGGYARECRDSRIVRTAKKLDFGFLGSGREIMTLRLG